MFVKKCDHFVCTDKILEIDTDNAVCNLIYKTKNIILKTNNNIYILVA